MKTRILAILAAVALAATSSAQSILPLTQLEQDLANINRAAQGTTYYGQLLVQALNNAHAAVWTLPDERLAAVLNKIGPANVVSLVELHSATAAALNQSLDAAGDTGPRAIVEPGRSFTWDGDVVVLAPVSTPED